MAEGNVFTPVCHSVHRERGGSTYGEREGVPWKGLSMETPSEGRRAPSSEYSQPGNTVNTRSVRVLLECILD